MLWGGDDDATVMSQWLQSQSLAPSTESNSNCQVCISKSSRSLRNRTWDEVLPRLEFLEEENAELRRALQVERELLQVCAMSFLIS